MNIRYIKTKASILEEKIPPQFYWLDIDRLQLWTQNEDWSVIEDAVRKDYIVYNQAKDGSIIVYGGFYNKDGMNYSRKERPSEEEKLTREEFFGKENVLSAEEYKEIIFKTEA